MARKSTRKVAEQVDPNGVHLTPADLAARLQMHVVTINKWRTLSPPKGPAYLKVERNCVRYTLAAVLAWEASREKKTAES